MAYGWKGHDHVDLLGACVAQSSYDVLAACPPYYAVVDHDDVLPVDYGADGYDLSDDLFSTLISRLDEAPEASLPPLPVFHKALFYRHPTFFRMRKSGRSSEVGDWHQHSC